MAEIRMGTVRVARETFWGRLLAAWVRFTLRRPWAILAAMALVFVVSGVFASKLGLRSDFIELLPTDSPSVINLEHLKQRVSSYSNLVIAVESPDLKASERFAEDLVTRLRTYPPERIRYIDYNLHDLTDFYKKNRYLYADYADLVDFRDRLKKRIHEETEAAAVESLDDEPAPKTDLKVDDLKKKYEKKASEQDRYPDGYYVTWKKDHSEHCTARTPNETLLAIFVRPPSSGAGFEASTALVRDVQAEVKRLNPASYHKDMHVGFTGDVKTGLEEYDALVHDMAVITGLCLLLILISIIVYYRSWRSVFIAGLPVTVGIVMSFAVAYFAIGYLNSATAFLSSIIAGNGINFMIIMAARFYEEVRANGPEDLDTALRRAVVGTAHGTVAAAAAASVAYGSLVVAGFRGFRQFGIIGGAGMLLCWLVTFAMGPALITVFHRWRPLGKRVEASSRVSLAARVGNLVQHHPGALLLGSVVLSVAAVAVTIPYASDPFEYDFHKLRNRVSATRGSAKLSLCADTLFDLPQSPTAVLVGSEEEAIALQATIKNAPGADDVIGDVKTLFDFLPKDQERKLAVLADIRALVDRKIDFLSDDDRKSILDNRPPDDLRVLTPQDVPDVVSRPFTESDGTRGRLLYVYSKPGFSLLNGRYLLRFASFLRGLDTGETHFVAVGQALIFADMVTAVLHDGVRVTFAALAGVLLLLILLFRSRLGTATIMVSVGLGTLWMIGFAALFDLKLNFLNFVVIPITLGIGVDYGANIFSRYRMEGPGRMANVLASTGGAVTLASLTTIIGYATLITSTNMALQSFGVIADIGEVTTLASAELIMTALIVWLEKRRAK